MSKCGGWASIALAAAIASTFNVRSSRAAPGDVTSCGTLGGNLTIAADAVNDRGMAVGSSLTSQNAFRAYSFSAPGPPRDLGSLAGTGSRGYGINNHDVIVGVSGANPGGSHAFRYSGSGPMEDLGTLPGGNGSFAHDINDAGVVVGFSTTGAGSASHAFRLPDTGPMQDLGLLPGGGHTSSALAINNAGVIVGGADDLQGVSHIFRVNGNGPLEDLGRLDDHFATYATGINEGGVIVGNAQVDSFTRAVRRLPGGPIVELGTLPGANHSEATRCKRTVLSAVRHFFRRGHTPCCGRSRVRSWTSMLGLTR